MDDIRRLDVDETWDADGNLISRVEVWRNPSPLEPLGALATLLAVTGIVNVEDAANAVGLTAGDLVAEAHAWAMFSDGAWIAPAEPDDEALDPEPVI